MVRGCIFASNAVFSISRDGLIGLGWFMVFNATFNNISVISWRCVFNGRGTLVPGENHEMVWGFACILTIHNIFIID
jgi:hypothetical protein